MLLSVFKLESSSFDLFSNAKCLIINLVFASDDSKLGGSRLLRVRCIYKNTFEQLDQRRRKYKLTGALKTASRRSGCPSWPRDGGRANERCDPLLQQFNGRLEPELLSKDCECV